MILFAVIQKILISFFIHIVGIIFDKKKAKKEDEMMLIFLSFNKTLAYFKMFHPGNLTGLLIHTGKFSAWLPRSHLEKLRSRYPGQPTFSGI